MEKKYVWVIVVVALFTATILILVSRAQDSQNFGLVTKTKEIIYGVNGYIPKKAFIKIGDTITFKNLGKSNRWPISDPHPNHNLYPNLNPEKEFQTGESWNFTFTEPGVWKHHDELSPNHQAVITVR